MENRRSKQAEVLDSLFRKIHIKDEYENPEILGRILEFKRNAPDTGFHLPAKKLNHALSLERYRGMDVVHGKPSSASERAVCFLHGGAYIHNINAGHLIYLQETAEKLKADVYAPLYPLAPKHKCEEAVGLVKEYLKDLLDQWDDVTLMGDSAGGGLAVSVCQVLHDEGNILPSRIVLFSPWLDVSLSNPDSAEYQDKDPVLSISGLRTCGKEWAGDLDWRDGRVSPVFGKTDFLPPVLMFSGTAELFYPDIISFYERLEAESVDAKLVTAPGLFHDYAMYPIPEGKSTLNTVAAFVLKSERED